MNNGIGYMNDYMNEMGKLFKNEKPKEINNRTNRSESKSGEINLSDMNFQSMDKQQLFESFMVFMNSQQNKNKEVASNISDQPIKKNANFSSDMNDYLNDNNGGDTVLGAELSYNNFNNEHINKNNNSNLEERESNMVSILDNINTTSIDIKSSSNINKFDEIPIKPKSQNFFELLDLNLANEKSGMTSNEATAKKKSEYVPRPKRTDQFKTLIQQPTEVKKYKYYSQNFDKEFGKGGDVDAVVEEITKKEVAIVDDKYSNKSKYKAHINKNRTTSVNHNRKMHPTRSNNSTNTASANHTNNSSNNKKNNIVKDSNNIWEDLKEVNKVLGNDDGEDDFLNAYSKPSANKPKVNKMKFKEEKIPEREQEYEIKMINNQNKPNLLKTQSKVNQLTEQVIQMSKGQKSNLDLNKERSPSTSRLDESGFLNNSNHIDKPSFINNLNNSNQYVKEEDSDDDRDIIRIYDEQYKNSLNIVNKNNNIDAKQSSSQNELENNNNNGLYKKPEQQKIINKYFKPFVKDTSKPTNNFNNAPEATSEATSNLDMVNEKIIELNKEIEKIKIENDKVTKLKTEYEKLTKKLNKEADDFFQKKQTEMQEFEQWKEEEMKKIEKERKMHLRNTKLLQNMPNRKEREEIDSLKEQVLKLQEDMKAKDQRNKLAMERLRKQLEESMKKNEDFQKEIKFMEEQRLKAMPNIRDNSQSITKVNASNDNKKKTITNQMSSSNLIQQSRNNEMNTFNTMNKQKSTNNILNNIVPKSAKNAPNTILTNSVKNYNASSKANQNNINLNMKKIRNTEYDNDSSYDKGSEKEEDDKIEDYYPSVNDIKNDINIPTEVIINSSNKNSIHQQQSSNDDNLEIKMNKIKVTKTTKSNEDANKVLNNNTTLNSVSKKQKVNEASPIKINSNNAVVKNKDTNKQVKPFRNIEQQEEENFDLILHEKYHGKTVKNMRLMKQDFTEDGKIIKLYENMKKEIIFPSGVRKEIFDDGYSITYFNNKDIKQVYPDSREVYLFCENKTLQFKFPDGLQVFKFDGGQIEKHYPDGTKVVNYIDGTIRNVYPDGYEETFFTDGSLQKVDKTGVVTIDYEDGIKDTIYPDGTKIREFPDGRVKKILPDKSSENYNK